MKGFLFSYHRSRRSDEGWNQMALVYAEDEEAAKAKLIKERTVPEKEANIATGFRCTGDLVPDNIRCLNID